jgi:hypothetical protein
MRALVLAAAIAAAPMEDTPLKRGEARKGEKRGRAERNRFSSADLEEMFGPMAPTPEPAPAPTIPEPDFIRWEPGSPLAREADASGAPLAA